MADIGVAMFTVTDQAAALAFYTEKLGSRSDRIRASASTGRCVGLRWPRPVHMRGWPSTLPWAARREAVRSEVRLLTLLREHRRLSAVGGLDLDPEPMRTAGAPLLFMMRDPDGNHIAVVEAMPSTA